MHRPASESHGIVGCFRDNSSPLLSAEASPDELGLIVELKWAEFDGLMPVLPGRRVNMGRWTWLSDVVVVVVDEPVVDVVTGLPGPIPCQNNFTVS